MPPMEAHDRGIRCLRTKAGFLKYLRFVGGGYVLG